MINPFVKQSNRARALSRLLGRSRNIERPWESIRAQLRHSRAEAPSLDKVVDLPTVPDNMLSGRFGNVNKALFRPDSKLTNAFTTPSGVKVEAAEPLEVFGRTAIPTRLSLQSSKGRFPTTYRWYQPFYRSSGRATPGRSPEGTIWPYSGHHASDDIHDMFKHKNVDGWFGKHFYDLPAAAKRYKSLTRERLDRLNDPGFDEDFLDWIPSQSTQLKHLWRSHSKSPDAIPPQLKEVIEGIRNLYSIR